MHRRPIIRALIFLLLVGPLQAQQVFACGMMDAVFLDDCCCEDHNNCEDSDSSDLITPENQCCEVSIELGFNDEANSEVDVIKSVEIRSDVDPPIEIVIANAQWEEPIRIAAISFPYSRPADSQGSNTYLVTQRIRI